jgi:hypothetical protein
MEKEFINPPELHKHPSYSRVVTVKGPCKFIFIARHDAVRRDVSTGLQG